MLCGENQKPHGPADDIDIHCFTMERTIQRPVGSRSFNHFMSLSTKSGNLSEYSGSLEILARNYLLSLCTKDWKLPDCVESLET